MNEITTSQNNPHFIELLKAQRVAYSQCKTYQIFDIVSIFIAIISPFLTLKYSNLQNVVNALGVLWTIAYLITEGYRRIKTEEGALIQEQFDTDLYKMKWNDVACKDKINIDKIQSLARKYNKNDLKNWYSTEVDSTLPRNIAVILCQRINFSWEVSQRKRFVILLIIAVTLYYFIYIAIGLYRNIGFLNLLILLSPSISFLIYAIQNILTLRSQIEAKNETLKLIDKGLEKYKADRTVPKDETLRQVQDVIFKERTFPEKIPDWFFHMYQSKNENFINELIIKIKANF